MQDRIQDELLEDYHAETDADRAPMGGAIVLIMALALLIWIAVIAATLIILT